MPAALIKIDQPANPSPFGTAGKARDDIILNAPVTLRNADNTGVQRHFWRILDMPPESSVALSNPTSPNATFVPDVYGTYRVYLRVNDGTGRRGMEDTRTVIVRDPAGFRAPAYLEGSDSNFQVSPGVHNGVGWLHELRRFRTAWDNRDLPLIYTVAGSATLDFETPWKLRDGELSFLEVTGVCTSCRFSIFQDAARTIELYRSASVNLTTPFRMNQPLTLYNMDSVEVYWRIENLTGASDDFTIKARIRAL